MINRATATITIVVTPGSAGPLSNTATVTSSTDDPTPTNNSSTADTTVNPVAVTPHADVSVTNTYSPHPPTTSTLLPYTTLFRSNGPDSAAAVSVNDTLPAGVSLVSATA